MESNVLFKNLFESISDAIYIIDFSTKKILLVNQTGIDQLGYTKTELIGREVSFLYPTKRLSEVKLLIAKLETEEKVEFESQHLRKDTKLIDVRVHTTIVSDGTTNYIQSLVRDITKENSTKKALIQSEKKLKSQYDSLPFLSGTWEKQGNNFFLIDINKATVDLSKGAALSRIGKPETEVWAEDPELIENIWQCHKSKEKLVYEKKYIFKTFEKHLYLEFTFVYVDKKTIRVFTRDISAQKYVIQALSKSNKQIEDLKYAIDQSNIVASTDIKGAITYVNDKFCQLSKYSKEELIGKDHRVINSGFHPKSFWKNFYKVIKAGKVWNGEVKNRAKDGSYYWVDTTVVPIIGNDNIPDQYISIRSEITKQKSAIEKINQNNSEKEILLKEIHHRVKNNMQVVTSLLSLQSGFIEDQSFKELFRNSQYRINSMGLVHEMLYQSNDLAKINLKEYIVAVIDQLIIAMKGSRENVTYDLSIEDVHLNMDTSIPIGLIINEVVTNSLKYGIIGNDKGKITISVETLEYPSFRLEIGDDGLGFSEKINYQNSKSLGMVLMHNLAKQLKGVINRAFDKKGTNYVLDFKEIKQPS